jgi:hypothetical protein
MNFTNYITKRHVLFSVLGAGTGLISDSVEPALGALFGMMLGISIAEITHIIDRMR